MDYVVLDSRTHHGSYGHDNLWTCTMFVAINCITKFYRHIKKTILFWSFMRDEMNAFKSKVLKNYWFKNNRLFLENISPILMWGFQNILRYPVQCKTMSNFLI